MDLKNEERELIQRFLSGLATDSEIERCESLVAEKSIDLARFQTPTIESNNDSFSHAVYACSGSEGDSVLMISESDDDSPAVSDLVKRIQKLVPQKRLNQEDLDRILNKSELPESIGKIDRYEVIEFIASGAMSVVFKGVDPILDRAVCIKVLNPNIASLHESKTRFQREAKSAANLHHDRIVMVLDVGEHRELPFFVMQLLDGETLRSKLYRGPINSNIANKFVVQILAALQYAHEKGVLHRDIKPENIWVTPDNDIKLLDFGLAQVVDESTNLTTTGTILGTPAYMSPEQIQGDSVDHRSDLFSVGTVLYEMLVGHPPYTKANLFSTMMSVVVDEVEVNQKSIPVPLRDLLQQLVQKKPEKRDFTAASMISRVSEVSSPIETGGTYSKLPLKSIVATICITLAFLFSGFAIYSATDVGTLVIEYKTPVTGEFEEVHIELFNPILNKMYLAKIGENKLPSGTYQFIPSDESSNAIRLPSEWIVIHRGKKRFEPAKRERQMLAKSNRPRPKYLTKASPQTIPKSFSHEAKIASPQNPLKNFARVGRKSSSRPPFGRPSMDISQYVKLAPMSEVLRSEPLYVREPLSLKKTKQTLGIGDKNPHFHDSLVVEPILLKKFETWTALPALPLQEGSDFITSINHTGTKIASADHSAWIRIWDSDFSLTNLVPVPGRAIAIAWSPDPSPKDSVALATGETAKGNRAIQTKIIGDFQTLAAITESKGKRSIMVWKVSQSKSSILYAMPSDAEKLRWSESGKELFVESKTGHLHALTFWQKNSEPVDISLSPKFIGKLPETNQEIFGRKYFVTLEEKQVSVWSLRKSERYHRFNNAIDARLISPTKLAVRQSNQWKVCDLDTLKTGRIIDIDANWSVHSLSPNGEKIAAIASGRLVIRNTLNLSELTLNYDAILSNFDNKQITLVWSADSSRLLIHRNHQFAIWKANTPAEASNLQTHSLESPRISWNKQIALSSGRLLLQSRGATNKSSQDQTRVYDLSSDSFLKINSHLQLSDRFAVSLDGRFVANEKNNLGGSGESDSNQDSIVKADKAMCESQIEIIQLLESGSDLAKPVKYELGGRLAFFEWTKDSRYLIAIESKEPHWVVHRWDSFTNKLQQFNAGEKLVVDSKALETTLGFAFSASQIISGNRIAIPCRENPTPEASEAAKTKMEVPKPDENDEKLGRSVFVEFDLTSCEVVKKHILQTESRISTYTMDAEKIHFVTDSKHPQRQTQLGHKAKSVAGEQHLPLAPNSPLSNSSTDRLQPRPVTSSPRSAHPTMPKVVWYLEREGPTQVNGMMSLSEKENIYFGLGGSRIVVANSGRFKIFSERDNCMIPFPADDSSNLAFRHHEKSNTSFVAFNAGKRKIVICETVQNSLVERELWFQIRDVVSAPYGWMLVGDTGVAALDFQGNGLERRYGTTNASGEVSFRHRITANGFYDSSPTSDLFRFVLLNDFGTTTMSLADFEKNVGKDFPVTPDSLFKQADN